MFTRNSGSVRSSFALRPMDRLTVVVIGVGVIFASLGLGEAVYRLLFLDLDGATDRFPIELLFGALFAWMTAKLVRKFYHDRTRTSARIRLIRDRNHKIRRAAEAIAPLSHPNNLQAIRVIREEVDRIEGALAEITVR